MSPEQVVYLRVAGLAVFATSCFAVWRLIGANARDDTLWSFALILLSMPFVVSSSWPHYFVYLPYVQAIIMSSSLFFLKIGPWYEYSRSSYLFVSNALLLLYSWARTLRPTASSLPPDG